MHTKTDMLGHTQLDNHWITSELAGHFRSKSLSRCDCVSVCLIVHGLVSIRSSMMPVVLLCMTHASVNGRHVVPYASTHKQNTDKKN